MHSPAVKTIIKMIESFPPEVRDQVVERLRDHLEDIRDEIHWDETFAKTQDKLASVARRVKEMSDIPTRSEKPS